MARVSVFTKSLIIPLFSGCLLGTCHVQALKLPTLRLQMLSKEGITHDVGLGPWTGNILRLSAVLANCSVIRVQSSCDNALRTRGLSRATLLRVWSFVIGRSRRHSGAWGPSAPVAVRERVSFYFSKECVER